MNGFYSNGWLPLTRMYSHADKTVDSDRVSQLFPIFSKNYNIPKWGIRITYVYVRTGTISENFSAFVWLILLHLIICISYAFRR